MEDMEDELIDETDSDEKPDVFKVTLTGCHGSGKTCLYIRMRDDSWCESPKYVGTDQFKYSCKVEEETVQLNIVDTVIYTINKENRPTGGYYLGSKAVLVLYCVEDMDSLNRVKDFLQDIQCHISEAAVFVIRSKIDQSQTGEEKVSMQQANESLRKWSKEINLPIVNHFSVSSKTGEGVHSMLQEIAKILKHSVEPARKDSDPFRLRVPEEKPNGKGSGSQGSSPCGC